ncbi:arginase family protein [Breoghania sp.]|uniref:arginase family protein n=1 Tax=Breoghania sp. TaxID=2065378 RepID=UPI00261B66AF|nr:arginase family protein [Breoghania sp.]MDJ0930705.1 arginase family protein [Breoghania sp.]
MDPTNVIFVGARDIDPEEEELINRAGARIIPAGAVASDALAQAVEDRKVWIHIDWDVLEPGYVSADYKVPGGLLPQQLRASLQALPQKQVLGLELAEYQASVDPAEREAEIATILNIVEPLFTEVSVAAI